MSVNLQKYQSVDNTVRNMYMLVNEFKDDPRLQVFQNYSLKEIFEYISKTIPYVPDPVPGQVAFLKGDAVEALKSPIQTMYNGGDCDDKSILAACIFEVKKIPYRFAVVSTQKNKQLHHVYLEIFYGGLWVPFDATYRHYKLFWENPFTKKKIYQMYGQRLDISEAQPPIMNQSSCSCSKSSFNNSNPVHALSGRTYNTIGKAGGVQLAILRGTGKSSCNCGGACCSKKKNNARGRNANDQRVIKQGYKNLLAGSLGDPITAVATVVTVVGSLFGGLFTKEKYQDAYNAWQQAESSLPQLAAAAGAGDQGALDQLSVMRALIAVLSRDYMNKPMGADVCTSAGRCGNRAEWLKIQPEVEAKTAAFAPFMKWLNVQHIQGNGVPPMNLTDLVGYYDQFKSRSGLYTQFQNSNKGSNKNTTGTNTAGSNFKINGPGLLLIAAAGLLAIKMKKGK